MHGVLEQKQFLKAEWQGEERLIGRKYLDKNTDKTVCPQVIYELCLN